jgi:hypothetical protein
MPKLTVPKFLKKKERGITQNPSTTSECDIKSNALTEGSQSGASEKEDAASGDPLFSESEEKNGLFMLHSKPENEEGLVEYVSL